MPISKESSLANAVARGAFIGLSYFGSFALGAVVHDIATSTDGEVTKTTPEYGTRRSLVEFLKVYPATMLAELEFNSSIETGSGFEVLLGGTAAVSLMDDSGQQVQYKIVNPIFGLVSDAKPDAQDYSDLSASAVVFMRAPTDDTHSSAEALVVGEGGVESIVITDSNGDIVTLNEINDVPVEYFSLAYTTLALLPHKGEDGRFFETNSMSGESSGIRIGELATQD